MAETSSSELLDVVNWNDDVVGSRSRGEVHRLQLPHRSVHVLVFNASDELLLQKRSMQKDECAGMWDSSCAGHVESGQDYGETVLREFEEELGIELDSMPEFLFKMHPNSGNGMEFAAVYRVYHDGPFDVAEDEIDELKWFSASQLNNWVAGVSLLKNSSVQKSNMQKSGIEGAVLTTGFCEIWKRYQSRLRADTDQESDQ